MSPPARERSGGGAVRGAYQPTMDQERKIQFGDPVILLGKRYRVARHYGGAIQLAPVTGPGRKYWLARRHFPELRWDQAAKTWRHLID